MEARTAYIVAQVSAHYPEDMVSRVALALKAADPVPMRMFTDVEIDEIARVAIAAMRKPTTMMIVAGGRFPVSIQEVWPELIDVALQGSL